MTPVDQRQTIAEAGSPYGPPVGGSHPRPAVAAGRARVARMAFGDDEELEKDLITFRLGSRRRLVSTLVIALSFLCAKVFGALEVEYSTIATVAGLATSANWLLTRIALRARRWWFRYAFAAFDAALISTIVYMYGSPGLVTIYFLAIVPYSFDRGRVLGYFTALACATGFLIAMLAAHRQHRGGTQSASWIVVDAILLLLVSHQIVPIASKLISRIRDTRECMAAAEHGDLTVRAQSKYADELGFLQRS
ncbi:MAG TPA: hypothetical protein VHM30_16880, partial [Gemmatimonadaceae bacterium]|nr:hypothetical protein [Gemmatimonadaceae bacterium]